MEFLFCLLSWIIYRFRATHWALIQLPGALGLNGLGMKCGVPSRGQHGSHSQSLFAHRCSHNRSRNLRSHFLLTGDKESCVGIGKARGREVLRRLGSSMPDSSGRRSSSLTRILIFHSRNSLGCLTFDESSARDLYMKNALDLDPRWWLEALSIDCAPLPVLRRVRKSLCGVRVTATPGIQWCCMCAAHFLSACGRALLLCACHSDRCLWCSLSSLVSCRNTMEWTTEGCSVDWWVWFPHRPLRSGYFWLCMVLIWAWPMTSDRGHQNSKSHALNS